MTEYITFRKVLSMIVAWIILGLIYLTLLLSVGLSILSGYRKGLYRTLLRFGVMLTSAVLAFIAVRAMHGIFSEAARWFLDLTGASADLEELIATSDSIDALINVLAGGIALPIVFLLLFAILEGISSIVFAFTSRKIPKVKQKAGLGVGALRGLVLALILLFPILGWSSMTEAVLTTHPVFEQGFRDGVGNEAVDAIEAVADKDVLYFVFGDNLVHLTMRGLTVTEFEGHSADVYDALDGASTVLEAVDPLLEHTPDISELSKEELAMIDDVLEAIDSSDLFASILADLIAPAADAWVHGEPYFGMESPLGADLGEGKIGDLFERIFGILATCDRDTVTADLHTIFEVALVLEEAESDSGENGDDLLASVCKGGKIDRLIAPFARNEHMKPVVSDIMALGVWALAQNMHAGLGEDEAYTEVVGTISNIVKDADMSVEKVSEELNTVMKDNGIEVSEELVTSFSTALVNKMESTGGDLTEEDMEEVLTEFAEVYAEELAEAFPDGLPDDLGDITLPEEFGDLTLPEDLGDITFPLPDDLGDVTIPEDLGDVSLPIPSESGN